MKKNAPKIPSRASKTLSHVKEFTRSDTPRWLVWATAGIGIYAVTRIVSHFIKSAGTGSDRPLENLESAEMRSDEAAGHRASVNG